MDSASEATRRFFAGGETTTGGSDATGVPRTVVCATIHTMLTATGSPATLAGSKRARDTASSRFATPLASSASGDTSSPN